MTAEDLLGAGWKEWPVSRPIDHHDRNFAWQVRGPDGNKLYAVYANFWQHSKHGNGAVDGWELWVQFNDGSPWHPAACVKVTVWHVNDWTPADAVAWAAEVWKRLGPRPYEEPDHEE